MAGVIFVGQSVAAIVLPLMLFHQIQLMVCAWLTRKYAIRALGVTASHFETKTKVP